MILWHTNDRRFTLYNRQGLTMIRWFAILFLSSTIYANAQVKAGIEGGTGLSYTHSKNISSAYLPVLRPNLGFFIDVPITDRIGLRSGIGYFPRGYNTNQTNEYDGLKFEFLSQTRMQFLSIPFMTSFRLTQTSSNHLWVDGGMNYNIFLHGKTDYQYSTYVNSERVTHSEFTHNIIGRVNASRYGPTENTYDVNGFDVAVKIQLRYVWHKRYSFSIYHENSLYEFRANPDEANSTLKLRYTGISIGYTMF